MKKLLLHILLLAVVLMTGGCRRAVEKSARKVRFEGIERVERQGLTGAEIVARINNGSAHQLTLASAEFDVYYDDSRVATVVLVDPVEIEPRTVASVTTNWRLKISDPLTMLVLYARVKAGQFDQIAVSCRVEGRGGPAPVIFSREKMPLSEFLNTFGFSIQDVQNYLK